MERLQTRLDGPMLIRPVVHPDERGFFQETYRRNVYSELGIDHEFVQDNHSRSARGVVRGMHFQVGDGMGKLVRCRAGCDLRRCRRHPLRLATFGEWESFELTDDNFSQLYCPVGFAHGFCVLSSQADVMYKQTAYHNSSLERGIFYADPDVAIAWPERIELTPSERDANAPLLREIEAELPFVYERSSAA